MSANFATGCNAPVEYVIADLHLGDNSLCGGHDPAANCRKRPFANADEMGREIVQRWNRVVRPQDIVYVLGDVGRPRHLAPIKCLHGIKHLIAGNGDDLAAIARLGLFDHVSVARSLPGCLLTHIPVHESQLRGSDVNVHGHLHSARIEDARYICVSVEQTGYGPIRLAELVAHRPALQTQREQPR